MKPMGGLPAVETVVLLSSCTCRVVRACQTNPVLAAAVAVCGAHCLICGWSASVVMPEVSPEWPGLWAPGVGGTQLPRSPQRPAAPELEPPAAADRWVWCILAIAGCPAEVSIRSHANTATLAGMDAPHAGTATSPQRCRRMRSTGAPASLRQRRMGCALSPHSRRKFRRLLEMQVMAWP